MADQVFAKDTQDTYGRSYRNDFVGEHEITVTVTLREYRELIAKEAKHAEEMRLKDEAILKAHRERDEAKGQLQGFLAKLGIDEGESEE